MNLILVSLLAGGICDESWGAGPATWDEMTPDDVLGRKVGHL
jgi:hypothetical protein